MRHEAPMASWADGWLASAERVSSPNFDARPAGCALELLVIHAISLPPGEFGGPYVRDFFCNELDARAHPYFCGIAEMRVSAHFFVGRDGALTQFVSIGDRAWHAGVSNWRGRSACNDFSVGIELEGTDELPFTALQYDALDDLLRPLLALLPDTASDRIVGHADIAPQRKTDPGPHFDWPRLRLRLHA